jgi:hypothetical protein
MSIPNRVAAPTTNASCVATVICPKAAERLRDQDVHPEAGDDEDAQADHVLTGAGQDGQAVARAVAARAHGVAEPVRGAHVGQVWPTGCLTNAILV